MTSTRGKVPDNNSSSDSTSFIRSLTTRTSLITTVAIAGVILAGGAAIAANIGILSAADSSPIGELSATELVAVPAAADTTSTTSTTTTPGVAMTSEYVVDDAGKVSLLASEAGLALGAATASDGWTPALSQSEPASLTVVFTNGARTVVFTASLGADGTIVADVTEPIVVTGASPNGPITIPTSPSYDDSDDRADDDGSYEDDDSYDDDDSYEDDDDDSDEDDEDDEDEEHEYEGADDDD